MMEQSFRQAMTISGANPVIFVSSAICIVLLLLSVLSIAVPLMSKRKKVLTAPL
jgi:TctA family transporter